MQDEVMQSIGSGPHRNAGADSPRVMVPQFALDAADAKIATWSTAIVDAADAIEHLVLSESIPVPDSVRELGTSTSNRLRAFGIQSGERDAAEMVAELQRIAAGHPAASIGVGAAVGAALAALLIRFRTSNAQPAAPQSTQRDAVGNDTK